MKPFPLRPCLGAVLLAISASLAQTPPNALPPTIMVLPRTEKGTSPLLVLQKNTSARQTQAAMNSYLTSQKYRVVDLAQISEIGNQVTVVSSLRNHTDDPIQEVAQATGADVYVTFEGEVATSALGSQTVLVLNAFETTTGRLLGTTSSPGSWAAKGGLGAVDEAARDSIGNLMGKVAAYWQEDNQKGIQYKVVLKYQQGIDEDLHTELIDAFTETLEKNFPTHEEITSTPSTSEYLIWAPREQYATSNKVSQVFRNKLGRSDVKVVEALRNRKLLILEVKPK